MEASGEAVSVTLAPGILDNIFDGIERPLERIAENAGAFITRGISVDSLDMEKLWDKMCIRDRVLLMERIAEKLSEIEKTARAIVDNAQEQKHQMEMQMQKKRDAFDADMEKETNEKILKIQSDLATNMEKLRCV